MKDLVIMQDKQAVTTSLSVAENFGKNHRDVLKSIDELKEGVAQNFADLFHESTYTHEQNKQQYRMFYINRDGFTLLAMGFTGKEALQFKLKYIDAFNQMEEKLKSPFALPGTYKEALLQLVEQVEENEKLQTTNLVLGQQISELKPKATYYDMVLQNKSLLAISTIAKDYGMSAIKMNKLLHDLGVQYKQGDIWLLYAKHQDMGYTQTSTHVIDADKSKVSTKWTQKGRLFIYDLLKGQGILPTIEREESA